MLLNGVRMNKRMMMQHQYRNFNKLTAGQKLIHSTPCSVVVVTTLMMMMLMLMIHNIPIIPQQQSDKMMVLLVTAFVHPSSPTSLLSMRHKEQQVHQPVSVSSLFQQQHQQLRIMSSTNNVITSYGTTYSTTTTLASRDKVILYNAMKPFNNDEIKNKITTTDTTNNSNIVFALLWISIVTLSFTSNPIIATTAMSVYDPTITMDEYIIQNIIQNPIHPNHVNEIFYCLFNIFAIVPILLSCFLLPIEEIYTNYYNNNYKVTDNQKSKSDDETRNIPSLLLTKIQDQIQQPQPFIIASAAIGYFAMGIYLSFRQRIPDPFVLVTSYITNQSNNKPKITKRSKIESNRMINNDYTWYTKNLWENSILHYGILLFLCYLPFGCNLVSSINENGIIYVYNDFIQLLSSSRLADISCIDLFFLHIAIISFIPNDYILRNAITANNNNINLEKTLVQKKTLTFPWNNKSKLDSSSQIIVQEEAQRQQLQQKANQIAFLAALFPYLGPALYVALRPSLLIIEQE